LHREISLSESATHEVRLTRLAEECAIWIDGRAHRGSLRPSAAAGAYDVTFEDRSADVWLVADGDTVYIHAFGRAWEVEIADPSERSGAGGRQADEARAPMPGVVIAIAVAAGDTVLDGQTMLTIESMKMQTQIAAPRDGVVERVAVRLGDGFDRGALLIALVPLEEQES
jgi:biotin carboxyl carrier protein